VHVHALTCLPSFTLPFRFSIIQQRHFISKCPLPNECQTTGLLIRTQLKDTTHGFLYRLVLLFFTERLDLTLR